MSEVVSDVLHFAEQQQGVCLVIQVDVTMKNDHARFIAVLSILKLLKTLGFKSLFMSRSCYVFSFCL